VSCYRKNLPAGEKWCILFPMLYDKDIREPLFEFLEEEYRKIRILEEKTINDSRADIMMVLPDGLVGIEIKSDADTYARLAGQVKDYDRFFDENIVVVGSVHAMHIGEHVPEYWGIITVEETESGPDFYILRQPGLNPGASVRNKLSMLWRPELAALQEKFGLPKYKNYSREFVIEKLWEGLMSEKIDPVSLHKSISDILFERDYSAVRATLKEYRKGELTKRIEAETDPEKKMALILEKEERRMAAEESGFIRKRRRRKKKR